MSESSRTSGVFIQPRWKRAPGALEKLLAFVMTVVPIVGLMLCTFDARNQVPKVKAAAEQLHNSARSLGLLAAADRDARLAAASSGSGLGERYAEGRRMMAEGFATLGRDLQADGRWGRYLPWIGGAVLGALGLIFCFFAWPLRRYASALYGAACFGSAAFAAALKWGEMGPVPAALVALPPVFLGALVGWHLVVVVASLQVGALTCLLPAWAFAKSYGPEHLPTWFIPVVLSASALVVALAYLFLVRAALISTLSVGGALAAALAATTLLVAWKGLAMPWEAILAIIVFCAVLGTLTQYRYAGGPKGEDGGEDDEGDNPYDYRPPARKKLKIKPA